MSLYDKYHSDYNKKYMFQLISDISQKELNININDHKEYSEYYEEQYPLIFEITQSEDISNINKELLDKMITIINSDNKEIIKNKKYIYSSYNREDLINQTYLRFQIKHTNKKNRISTIIIPESNSDIIYPIKQIIINNKEQQ